MKAASSASAMRWPGGGKACAKSPPAASNGAASARTASRSSDFSMTSASRSMNSSSAACSLACTRPRWRSGSDSVGSRMIAPTTGRPIASIASAASRRCRSLATRLSTTPAIVDAGIVGRRSPWRWPPPSATGRRRRAPAAPAGGRAARDRPPRPSGPVARNAVEQAHGALDDHQVGAVGGFRRQGAASSDGCIAQLSRLTPGRPVAAAWKPGSM